jgi:glucosamine--fructose-6-phosphate aminotransferase (isomerizing)
LSRPEFPIPTEKETLVATSPFERDIDDQAEALGAFLRSRPADGLADVARRTYDRIVLTGMGSSHSAALPTWRHLVEHGYSAWWTDSGQLLDTPHLVTGETLLVATSQSGASGEVSALFGPSSPVRPKAVIGVTNEPGSPLGRNSDAIIELCSGTEATVSTKSYLNTLAAHQRLLGAITGRSAEDADGAAVTAAAFLKGFTAAEPIGTLAEAVAHYGDARVAFVGHRDHAASALYAGLITKEAVKVPAEGYIGGQFRHGPLELAGEGLTAILFGVFGDDDNPSLRQLAADLVATGAAVALVGDVTVPGAHTIPVPAERGTLTGLVADALVAQQFAVAVGRARGIEPGAFKYGSKVTTAL